MMRSLNSNKNRLKLEKKQKLKKKLAWEKKNRLLIDEDDEMGARMIMAIAMRFNRRKGL